MRHIYPPSTFDTAKDGPGARAYCGHIKTTPWTGALWSGARETDRCPECLAVVDREDAA